MMHIHTYKCYTNDMICMYRYAYKHYENYKGNI